MKLVVNIPVEKVRVGNGYTFRCVSVEVEPVRILRSPAGRDRHTGAVRGWRYEADVKHPDIARDAWGVWPDGTYRASISRTRNPAWKPPAFPEGVNWVLA